MKVLHALSFFLVCSFSIQNTFAQDSSARMEPDHSRLMQDTIIYLEGSFLIRNPYAAKDSLIALKVWASKMHDTTIALDPGFIVSNVYAAKDALLAGPPLSKRDSLVRAIKDSLSRFGSALLHTADMQDTIIALDPAFVVRPVYASRDLMDSSRAALQASLASAAMMQDTIIALEPSFVVRDRYIITDLSAAARDSLNKVLAQASIMQDTTIVLEPAFAVTNVYVMRDKLDAIRDSIAKPATMQDTTISLDPAFVIKDLYPLKDSMDAARDSLTALTDSLNTDSVRRHWAGWKNYEEKPQRTFTLNSNTVLKGKSKNELQYNIADFYLTLNGEQVLAPPAGNSFFAAACLAFKYDDTLLLNSGLGSKMGIGVGIKIYKGKFTSSLHANTHNTEIYKMTEDDSLYLPSVIAEPLSQSLTFKYFPDGSRNEILTGEYVATFRKFYQKNEEGQDEVKRYSVRIVFRCRVSGGISSLK